MQIERSDIRLDASIIARSCCATCRRRVEFKRARCGKATFVLIGKRASARAQSRVTHTQLELGRARAYRVAHLSARAREFIVRRRRCSHICFVLCAGSCQMNGCTRFDPQRSDRILRATSSTLLFAADRQRRCCCRCKDRSINHSPRVARARLLLHAAV